MGLTEVSAFTAAMRRKDLGAMPTHMADDVILNTPLWAEPVKGKAAIRQVVGALPSVVDKFDFHEIMRGSQHVSSFFKVAIGPNQLGGMDQWRVNEAGLIQGMTVLWRPLPARGAVRSKLARADGAPA